MSEEIKALVRELVTILFGVVTGPGTAEDKAARIKRATEALASETAADAAIDKALGELKNE